MSKRNALSVTRAENFNEWYVGCILESGLAEYSSVRGCMVIKPWGYAIWERMQSILDSKFKELDVQNCYFPMFIPVDLFNKEADHVSGFAKEMAIVTHSKLENIDGKLVPTSPLEIPLAIRPTSEMIIGESFKKWINSYRDLPIKVNQWANVVRWEMRTRLFLRTMEFLWQEGHTAFATAEEAEADAKQMHDVYYWFMNDILKIHSVKGIKPAHEKFPGAEKTFTIEAMMQDGKALQCMTSHYLGQTFAKAVGIQFQGKDGNLSYAHTSSWGCTTRLIGALVMNHADDDGVNLPSNVAPYNIVIIPIIKSDDASSKILEYCDKIKTELKEFRVLIDKKDISPQNKKWDYVRKGVPIICEIGIRDLENNNVFFTKRLGLEKESLDFQGFVTSVPKILLDHDKKLIDKSSSFFYDNSGGDICTLTQLKQFFEKGNGFVTAPWCEDADSLKELEDLSLTIRCEVSRYETPKKCVLTGKDAFVDVIFAKAY